MKEQTYYYLIGGEIKKGKLMPKIKLFDAALTFVAKQDTWLNSLQPCSITDGELKHIKLQLEISYGETCLDDTNPIEVTELITDNDGVVTFREGKSEANEAVDEPENKYHFAREILFTLRANHSINETAYLHWIDKLIQDEKLFKTRNNK